MIINDNSYYEFYMTYDEYIWNNINNKSDYLHTSEDIEMVPCTTELMREFNQKSNKLEDVSDKYFVNNALDTFMCPKFNNRIVGGSWTDTFIRYFTIFLKRCDKTTEEKYNIVCQPQEVMDNPYYLGFKSLNYLNKPNNFSNPTQLHFNFKDIKEICKH